MPKTKSQKPVQFDQAKTQTAEQTLLESLPAEARAAMEAMQRVMRAKFTGQPFTLPRVKYAQCEPV